MLKTARILVIGQALAIGMACTALLTGCGQKGPLFLPTTPESQGRATLPQTLKPWPSQPASSGPTASEPHR